MHDFLGRCQIFTRSLRLLIATWRWIESAKVRRLEVGVEEAMVSIHFEDSSLKNFLKYSNDSMLSVFILRHSWVIESLVCWLVCLSTNRCSG
jgi:hypothetical protein